MSTKIKLSSLRKPKTETCDENAESKYFKTASTDTADKLLQIELDLNDNLKRLTFKPQVDCVYAPLDYAFTPHAAFTRKYCTGPKKILFVGVNPGPWGMSQTGVPFGEVSTVRDWLKIEGAIQKPIRELPSRPVTGLKCPRTEISGQRFWSLFKQICTTPQQFFQHAFIYNYCPVALMKESGSNITPAELKGPLCSALLAACDYSLSEVVRLLDVEILVGVGKFTQKRAEEVVKKYCSGRTCVVGLLHPSPRVPGNEDWQDKALQTLNDLDLIKYFCSK